MPRSRPRALLPLLAASTVALSLPALTLGAPATAADRTEPAPAPLFSLLEGYVQPHADRVDGAAVRVRPSEFDAYRVDVAALADRLTTPATGTRVRVSVPGPDGVPTTFSVVEDSVMEPGLQQRYPDIRTYAGRVVGDPTSSVRLDVTPLGFHASVKSQDGAWLIDPAVDAPGTTTHLTYDRSALPADAHTEGLVEGLIEPAAPGRPSGLRAGTRTPAGGLVTRRTYRLALVTDPAYARYFGTGGQPASASTVLAQKTILVNRINQIYNDDLGIRLVLVDGTDRLNLTTTAEATAPNGPCGASPCYAPEALAADGPGCDTALLDRNQFVIGQLIGADRYDVGHIMLGGGGGGVAYLGAVGGYDKAGGCTGLSTPTGDVMAIDYVAHELGHQFAANHTFNGTQGACSGANRNAGTSVEPGSGSSVMGYAGICGTDNLQPHTDPAFSQRSIDEITEHVTASPSTFDEVQTISMVGFDLADSVTFNYPGEEPVSIGTSPLDFNTVTIAQTVSNMTGYRPVVTGYDARGADAIATPPDGTGFTLTFDFPVSGGAGIDLQRISVTSDTTGFSSFTGVQVNGGPGTNQGGIIQQTGNHAPTVTAPADKTIPMRTPFALTGTGSDVDGDALTYTWEQNDAGGQSGSSLNGVASTTGPLFRIFGSAADVSREESLTFGSPDLNLPQASPTRSFPDFAQVLADRTNAATGTCPAASDPIPPAVLECYSELLPTAARTLNFRVTSRDGFPSGGGTQFDDTVLTVGNAGPFRVTSQPTAVTVEGGAPGTITWDVAGTNAPEYAPEVRIVMSTDGGATFPNVLATTPNDGSAQITWPTIDTDQARIRIEAVGNYFYDVNRSEFSVNSPVRLVLPTDVTVDHSDALLDASGNPLTVEVTGLEPSALSQLQATVTGVTGVTAVRRGDTGVFDLVGAVTDAPGMLTANVRITGPDILVQQGFPVAVTAEDVDVRFTGPTEAEIGDPVTLSVALTEPADGSPGDPRNADVTFVDRAGDALCAAATSGTLSAPTASCTFTPTGEPRTMQVGTVVSGTYVDDDAASDSDLTLVVVLIDDVPPETSFLKAPDAIVVDSAFVIEAISSEPGSRFTCSLDGASVSCPNGAFEVRRATPGTHVLKVVTTDKAGNVDRTAAQTTFTVPFNDSAFKILDGWKRVRTFDTFSAVSLVSGSRGALLTAKIRNADQLALIVSTGPRGGRIAADIGRTDLGSYSLRTDEEKNRVLVMLPIGNKRAGNLEIRTLSKRPVRVEGLAVVTNP